MTEDARPQFGLRGMLAIVALLGVVFASVPPSFTPEGMALMLAWSAAAGGQIVAVAWAFRRQRGRLDERDAGARVRRGLAISTTLIAALPALTTLALFRIVFGGGGSNVAQYNSEATIDLWSLWFDAWLPLYFLNHLCVLVTLLTFTFYLRPRSDVPTLLARLFGLANCAIATWVTRTFFPDA